MITLILTSFLSFASLYQADSIDYRSLRREWNETYVRQVVEWEEAGRVYYISLDGGVVYQYQKNEDGTPDRKMYATLQQADYLFSIDEDDYYLIDRFTPTAPPSKNYL